MQDRDKVVQARKLGDLDPSLQACELASCSHDEIKIGYDCARSSKIVQVSPAPGALPFP